MIKAVLFDVDGVLLDSDDGLVEMFAGAVESVGYARPSRGEVLAHVGLPAAEWLRLLMPGASDGAVEKAVAHVRKVWPTIVSGIKPMRDAEETLRGLQACGVKIAIVTNQKGKDALLSARRFSVPFNEVVFLSDDFRPKPAPDLLLEALRRLCVDKPEALFVGDTGIDVETGKAAGVRTVILAHERNAGLNAERIGSLLELLKMVDGK